VTDNQRCISLPGHGYINAFVDNVSSHIRTFKASGTDVDDLYLASQKAIDYSRSMSRPSFLLVQGLPRRFGHAATDRQLAYMSSDEIQDQADRNPLAGKHC
jgi:TPP-dependent pyruvate/acetoin dehydrogenase alpha subunit